VDGPSGYELAVDPALVGVRVLAGSSGIAFVLGPAVAIVLTLGSSGSRSPSGRVRLIVADLAEVGGVDGSVDDKVATSVGSIGLECATDVAMSGWRVRAVAGVVAQIGGPGFSVVVARGVLGAGGPANRVRASAILAFVSGVDLVFGDGFASYLAVSSLSVFADAIRVALVSGVRKSIVLAIAVQDSIGVALVRNPGTASLAAVASAKHQLVFRNASAVDEAAVVNPGFARTFTVAEIGCAIETVILA